MKNQRYAVIAVTTVAAMALAACSGSSDSSSSGTKDVSLVLGVVGDPFYTAMKCGATDAAKKAGVKLDITGPKEFKATLQNPILEGLVASKPDAVLVAPNDVVASANPLKRLQKNGSKVVLVDTVVNDPSIGVSRIATNNNLGGQKAAEALKEFGKTGSVMVVSTDPGVSSVDARVAGFKTKAAEFGFKFASDTQYSHDKPSVATEIITAAITAHPDLTGVFATNLLTAQGIAAGIKKAGKAGKINVVVFDAGPEQVKALKGGEVQALIAQQPYMIGQKGIEQAVAAIDGKKVESAIQTDLTIVTKDNVDKPEMKQVLYPEECPAS
jgi:ribose transport system substrate-binding protein